MNEAPESPETLAKQLAFDGCSEEEIRRELEARGMGGILDEENLRTIILEANTARHFMQRRPSRKWPRVIGWVAVIMGVCGVILGATDADLYYSNRRYSPGGYGFLGIIFGLILILKPEWASERLK